MDLYSLYYFSLACQCVLSLALAGWLWAKGPHQSGIKPLALFCVGVGSWGLGQLAMHLGDDDSARFGKFLVNCGPLNAVFFLHFVFRFLERDKPRQLAIAYGLGILTLLAVQVFDMGTLKPWLAFKRFYFFPAWGWIPGIFVSVVSMWAYYLVLAELPGADPKRRGKILAICFAGVWGSASTLMFLNASFGIDHFPYSVILFPGYGRHGGAGGTAPERGGALWRRLAGRHSALAALAAGHRHAGLDAGAGRPFAARHGKADLPGRPP
jgi:hypothetical protein